MTSIDVDAYLQRVGWKGEIRPTCAALAGLLRAHMEKIPFENLDVLLGRPIRLDLESVQQKLVKERRGGYCFEHVTLFAGVLRQLGFKVATHTARVVLMSPRDASPRAHMFAVVTLPEGTFVADPGFGGLAPRLPVPLEEGQRVAFGDETHWFDRDDGFWVLRANVAGKPADMWVSTLDRDYPVDFEIGNHFTSTHPASPFRRLVMMKAVLADGCVTVMNQDVKIIRGGKLTKRRLEDRAALRALLKEYFGFDLPEVEMLRVPMIPEWGEAAVPR